MGAGAHREEYKISVLCFPSFLAFRESAVFVACFGAGLLGLNKKPLVFLFVVSAENVCIQTYSITRVVRLLGKSPDCLLGLLRGRSWNAVCLSGMLSLRNLLAERCLF